MAETHYDLSEILNWIGIHTESLAVSVNSICLDSRSVKRGSLFIALSGFNVHGMDYAYQAQRAGAVAILVEDVKVDRAQVIGRQKPLRIPIIEIERLGGKLGILAANFYGHPSKELKITAITGTNGKTSTAWLLTQMLKNLGCSASYMGTLGYGDLENLTSLDNTTPSALAIQSILAEFVEKGVQHVCIEVSSHALDQQRIKGLLIDTAVFTNLSRDHLDYHRTMKAYAETKTRLFTEFSLNNVVINIDDDTGFSISNMQLQADNISTCSVDRKKASFIAKDVKFSSSNIEFMLKHKNNSQLVITDLLGRFNVENLLAVIAVLSGYGYKLDEICRKIKGLSPVPGRMNRIACGENHPLIVVDYAHTPDALEQVLKALKEYKSGQLWCIFGCGGNRDKGKRPVMGRLAEKYADKVILTDDNPRFEDPDEIIAGIEFGMKNKAMVIRDRKQAITYAIDHCDSDDLILIAGKGHESIQEIKGRLLAFNDAEVVLELLGEAVCSG